MQVLSADEVRGARRFIPLSRDRAGVRIYAAGMTALFIGGQLVPAMYLISGSTAPVLKVALVSNVSAPLFGFGFFMAALLALPHLISLVFMPDRLGELRPRRLACIGAGIGAVLYLMLGGISVPLDLGVAPWTYYAKAFGCLIVGTIYALSINTQMVEDNEKSAVAD